MTVTESKLQIFLTTFNREKYLKRTLNTILSENSPVRKCDIIVFDNNSTDGTGACVREFMRDHPNLSYHKNKYNILTANFTHAMEAAEKEYYWNLCDDDFYDWTSWVEVENAMERGEDMIIVARYALQDDVIDDIPSQIYQCTFIPAIIYKTEVLNDEVMQNAVILGQSCLFPHLCPMISLVNQNKKAFVISKPIVFNGMDAKTDASYTRGTKRENLFPGIVKMTWVLGYSRICTGIKDKNLREKVFITGFRGGFDVLHNHIAKTFDINEDTVYIEEIAKALNEEQREIFRRQLKEEHKKGEQI